MSFIPFSHIRWNSKLLVNLAQDTFQRIMDRAYTASGYLHEQSFERYWPFTYAMYPIFGQIGQEWGCLVDYEKKTRQKLIQQPLMTLQEFQDS